MVDCIIRYRRPFCTKQLGAIHGNILTAWAAAGLVGEIVVSWIRETTGSYQGTLIVFSLLFLVALTISLLIQLDIQKLRQLNAPQRDIVVKS